MLKGAQALEKNVVEINNRSLSALGSMLTYLMHFSMKEKAFYEVVCSLYVSQVLQDLFLIMFN